MKRDRFSLRELLVVAVVLLVVLGVLVYTMVYVPDLAPKDW
jgi:hypothetical protein